jgi:hypothetical protein
MADRASSAALRKQWNQRAPGGGHTPAARRSRLGLYTVVLLALVGLLVYVLWPQRQSVYFALLAEKYGPNLADTEKREVELLLQPTIDPTAMFDRDLAPLEKAITEKEFVIRNLAQQGTAKQIAGELPKYLAEAAGRASQLDKVELVVLYVHAYGLSIDGEPYLLWNGDLADELRRTQGKPALFPLRDLLGAAGGLAAQRTLVLLDCGELPYEPRLGMYVNEFPGLLETEMTNGRHSDKLWVMCGHSALETSHVWEDDRRSVFGHFVAEALSKSGDNDTDLTAAAFFRLVHDKVERAALLGTGAPQHPMFLIGGKGKVKPEDVPKNVILKSLFFVSQPTPTAADSSKPRAKGGTRGPLLAVAMPRVAQAEKTPEPKTPAAAQASGEKKGDPKKPAPAEKTAPSKPEEKKPPADASAPAAAPAAGASEPDAAATAKEAKLPERDPFSEIWDLCHELEDPDNRGIRWSPVDYAPHLWSRFRRELMWYQLRAEIEGGLAQNTANRAYIERSIREPLRVLSKAGEAVNVSAPGAISILTDIVEARRQFFDNAVRRHPGGNAATPDERHAVANFARARRVANAIQFTAGECVRLYGFNLHSGESDRYSLLVGAIGDAAKLRQELEDWEGKALDDGGLDWTRSRELCDEHLHNYELVHSRLRDELGDLVKARLKFGTLPRSPSGQAQRRPTPQMDDIGLAHWIDLTLRLGAAGWSNRSGDVAGAYLLEVPALASSRGLDKHLATLARITGNLRADADLSVAYRELGSAIRQAALALPRAIADGSAPSSDVAAARLAEIRLRLLDPADAKDDALLPVRSPLLARTWFPQPGPKLEITGGSNINLQPGEQRDVELKYQWTGNEGEKATIEIKHANTEGGASVISIVPGRTSATVSRSGTLPGFSVKAPREIPTGGLVKTTTEVIYTVRIGRREFSSKPIAVRLVGEDFVDLVITRVTDENKPQSDQRIRADEGDVGVGARPLGGRATLAEHRLSPYSRGVAKYRFSLASGGGNATERKVVVDVFRVVKATNRIKKNEFDARGELKPGVADPIDALPRREMTLRQGEPQTFQFDYDPAKKAAGKDAETTAEKAAEKPKSDANNGGGQNDAPAADPKAADPKAEAKPPADAKTPAIDLGGGFVFRIEEPSPAGGGAPRVWWHWVEIQPLHPSQYVKSKATYDVARRKLEIVVEPNKNLPYPDDGFQVEWEAAETNADIAGWSGSPAGLGTRQRDIVRLIIQDFVPKTDKDTLDVFVAVDGYPRAFYHPVMVNGGAVVTESTSTFRRVRVVAPNDAKVFKGDPDDRRPFPILVEARFDDIPEERDKIQVTFDDGQPTTETLASSRARHAYFTPGKNGAAAFDVRVGDYVRDPKGKTDGDAIRFTTTSRDIPITITAEIAGVSDSYRDVPPTRSVLVDYRDPTLTAAPPRPSQVAHKKPETIELAAVAADAGGIARVDYYLVGQDKARLDKEDLEKKNLIATWPMGRPKLGESAPRPVSYSTEKLDVGRYYVWAIAYDRADRKSLETPLGSFRVNEPAPAGEKKVAGVTVRGQAVYNNTSRDGITITLKTLDGAEVATTQPVGEADPAAPPAAPGGRPPRPQFWFIFKDVAPGTYVLTAKGTEKTPEGRVGAPHKLVELDPLQFVVKPSDKDTVTLEKQLKLTKDR